MKKLILIFPLLVLFFASCKQEYDILSYQANDLEAHCTVNENYEVIISKNSSSLSLHVLSPDSLNGVSFEITDNTACILKDDMKIDVKKDSLAGICAILNSFSLREEAITTVNQNNVISFDTDYGIYTVTYGENNLPYLISITGEAYEYQIKVNSIKIQ